MEGRDGGGNGWMREWMVEGMDCEGNGWWREGGGSHPAV